MVDFDRIRRQYLLRLYEYTDRNVILYASGWMQKKVTSPAMLQRLAEKISRLSWKLLMAWLVLASI